MARCFGLVWYLMLVDAFLYTATADDYELNWIVPTSADNLYANWTSKELKIGDTVIFNWAATHDVANVSKAEYDNCTKTNSLLGSTSPVKVNFSSIGNHYFICTVGPHCTLGQKVTLVVKNKDEDKAGNAASALGGLFQVFSMVVTYFLSYHV